MTEIKLIECPRDAWQGLRGQIPSYIKIDYLKALISAGFKHLVCRPLLEKKTVPQMADSVEVLRGLDLPDAAEIRGIFVNQKGVQRTINTNPIRTLGFH